MDELDRNNNTEKQGLEKYSVSKFMRYQMVEDRSVAEQTHEIINLEHALAGAEMKLPEEFLVIIEEEHRNQTHKMSIEHHPRANLMEKQKVNKAKLCPSKKVKTGQAAVNMVAGGSSGASTSGATDGHHGKDSKHGELDRKRGLEVFFRAHSIVKKSLPRTHCQKKYYQWFCNSYGGI
ncbi:UNVERIFIED_CONTAM: hypothetical protein Slati_3668300 [Sesamum latifolium]|uniref:Uncharacterized protein n=1 Tax=Sesamum latifolium TaxID=2727402 RepID=A0AAW2U599_9LAMI